MPDCECPNCGHAFDPKPPKKIASDEDWARFLKLWNDEVAAKVNLQKVMAHGQTIRLLLGRRLVDLKKQTKDKEEAWKLIWNAMRLIRDKPFYHQPKVDSAWVADAEWMLQTTKRINDLSARFFAFRGGNAGGEHANSGSSRALALE